MTTMPAAVRARVHAVVGGFPRAFWVLWAGMFVNRAGAFVLPFLAIYLTQGRGLSAATAGVVVACYGAGAAVASPLGGFFADHLGRRGTMIASLLFGGLGMIALGFAHDIAVIAPGCFLVGMVCESYRPAMTAAVSDLVPPHDRVRAFGLLYWVINLGFSFGLLLAGILASRSFLLLFVGDGLTSIAFALLVWRLVPETRPPHPEHAEKRAPGLVHGFLAPYREFPFAMFLALTLLVLLLFMQHVAALPIGMSEFGLSRKQLGLLLALNGIVIVVLQPVLAPVITRWNRSRTLALGSVLVGLGFGVNAFAHDAWTLGLGIVIWTVGEILVLPIGNALVADVAPTHLRGRYQGAYGLCFGLAAFAAPLLGTAVLQRFGQAALWYACLAVGVVTGVGHLLLEPRLSGLRDRRVAERNVG